MTDNKVMDTTKKISLAVVILVVIGAIWYLESMKVHPTSSGSGVTLLGLSANTTTTVPEQVAATSSSVPGSAPVVAENSATVTAALQALAQADQKAGYQPAVEIAEPDWIHQCDSSFSPWEICWKASDPSGFLDV